MAEKFTAGLGAFIQGQVKTLQDTFKPFFDALTPTGRFVKTFADAEKTFNGLAASNLAAADLIRKMGNGIDKSIGDSLADSAEYALNFQEGLREFSQDIQQFQQRIRFTEQDSAAVRKALVENNYNSLKDTEATNKLIRSNVGLGDTYKVQNDRLLKALSRMDEEEVDIGTILGVYPEMANLKQIVEGKGVAMGATQKDIDQVFKLILDPTKGLTRAQLNLGEDIQKRFLGAAGDTDKALRIIDEVLSKVRTQYNFISESNKFAQDNYYQYTVAQNTIGMETLAAAIRWQEASKKTAGATDDLQKGLDLFKETVPAKMEAAMRSLDPTRYRAIEAFPETITKLTGAFTKIGKAVDILNALPFLTGLNAIGTGTPQGQANFLKEQIKDLQDEISASKKISDMLQTAQNQGLAYRQRDADWIDFFNGNMGALINGEKIYLSQPDARDPQSLQDQDKEINRKLEQQRKANEEKQKIQKELDDLKSKNPNIIVLYDAIKNSDRLGSRNYLAQLDLIQKVGQLVAKIENQQTLPSQSRVAALGYSGRVQQGLA